MSNFKVRRLEKVIFMQFIDTCPLLFLAFLHQGFRFFSIFFPAADVIVPYFMVMNLHDPTPVLK